MKKSVRLLALFIATTLICVFLLSSCHGSVTLEPFVCPEEFDTDKDITITFWAKNDTNLTQMNIYNRAISDFEKLYPNVTVKLTPYTDYGRIYNDVITKLPENAAPNVCITYPDHIATYMTGKNAVVSLDELMENAKYGLGGSELKFDGPTKDEIVPKFLEECKIGGEYYALPYMRSTEACYVNKTYVEALGFTLPDVLTWDFVFDVCEAAMEKDENGNYKVNGQSVLIPMLYKSTDNMMIQMLEQKDAGYSTPDGKIELFNDTTRELLAEIAKHAESRSFSTFKISSYPANFLNAGQCIFAIDSTAGATWMGSNAPLIDIDKTQLKNFETVVMTVPQFDTESPEMISQGPSVCIFNKADEQEVLASWLFVQFLLTNRVQIDYATTEGYVPVTTKAQTSDEYIDYLSREGEDNQYYYDIKLKATKLLLDNTDNTFVTPVFNGSASLRNCAGQLIEEVTKAERRGETVDAAYIDTVFDEVQSLFKIDQIGENSGKKQELGPMPKGSVILLSVLGTAWLGIIGYASYVKIKDKRRQKNLDKS